MHCLVLFFKGVLVVIIVAVTAAAAAAVAAAAAAADTETAGPLGTGGPGTTSQDRLMMASHSNQGARGGRSRAIGKGGGSLTVDGVLQQLRRTKGQTARDEGYTGWTAIFDDGAGNCVTRSTTETDSVALAETIKEATFFYFAWPPRCEIRHGFRD